MFNRFSFVVMAIGRTLLRSVTTIARVIAVMIVSNALGAQATTAVESLRLYVMDCGLLTRGDPMMRFGLTTEQVAGLTDLVTPCFLIAHPKGTILWDTGMVPIASCGRAATRPSLATWRIGPPIRFSTNPKTRS